MRDLTIGLLVLVAYSLYYYYYNFTTNDPLMHVALMYIVSLVVAIAPNTYTVFVVKEIISPCYYALAALSKFSSVKICVSITAPPFHSQ